MKNILFVCTGNTCRSPMAEAIFNEKAKKLGFDAISASRGLFVNGSFPISENARVVLYDLGIKFNHTSTVISENDLKSSDMVFGITQNHAKTLCTMFPDQCDKIYSFPTDISDPYGLDIDSYKACLNEISLGIDKIIAFGCDAAFSSICTFFN